MSDQKIEILRHDVKRVFLFGLVKRFIVFNKKFKLKIGYKNLLVKIYRNIYW